MFEATSFSAYIIDRYPPIELARHHFKVIRALTAVERGECKRLIMVAPPRHTKSMLTSEFFPPWCLGRDPRRQLVSATYGQELSSHFGRRVKDQVDSEEYRSIFPACKIRGDSCTATRIDTVARGRYVATSVGGAATGIGADILTIDDAFKGRAEAESLTIRNWTWDWYTSVARTRLQPGGAIIVMGTRWHEDDLIGRLLSSETKDKWTLLHLPAISETGEALWPEWYPIDVLNEIRTDIGSYDFDALYMGRPTTLGGGMLKASLIKSFTDNDAPKFSRMVQFVDSAHKTGAKNDYSCIVTAGEAVNGYYVMGIKRGKWEYPQLRTVMAEEYEKWHPIEVEIEDKSSGTPLIQEMRQTTALPIVGYDPKGESKTTRALPLAAAIEAGKIYLHADIPCRLDAMSEIAAFPNGTHDDIIDPLSMMVHKFRKHSGKTITAVRSRGAF